MLRLIASDSVAQLLSSVLKAMSWEPEVMYPSTAEVAGYLHVSLHLINSCRIKRCLIIQAGKNKAGQLYYSACYEVHY